MNFTTVVIILFICDMYMVITQSAESGDGQNDPQSPRSDRVYMSRKQKSTKDKRVRSSQDKETIERGRLVGESSAARRNRTGKTIIEHDSEGVSRVPSKRRHWTNEEYERLLRLAYANYDCSAQNNLGAIDWKSVVTEWHGEWNTVIRDSFRFKLGKIQKKMRSAVNNFDNGGTRWYKQLDNELLRIYFATEAGDESKHAERIYNAWMKEYPEHYRGKPAYLLERAKTMIFSAMKFSLDNPRGISERIKPKQLVDWKSEHNRLLQFLWRQPSNNVTTRKQQLYDEAVKRCSAMQHLNKDQVYKRAKWVNSKSEKSQKEIHFDEGFFPNTTHVQYHSFMDDRNFPSLNLGTHGHHFGMASTSTQPGPSHNQTELNLDLNISHPGKQSPDTNLYLGFQSHRKDKH